MPRLCKAVNVVMAVATIAGVLNLIGEGLRDAIDPRLRKAA
jgi:ABC-type dipeptide/oligopeptide/nickel transport system permease subunit